MQNHGRRSLAPATLPDTAAAARAVHLRRQLAAAVDHGAELLAALGLPQPVGPDHIATDTEAAGAALDTAIAALDALDGDPDLVDGADNEAAGDDEFSLGWREAVGQLDLGNGRDDDEPTLGVPERPPFGASQVSWAQGSRLDGEGEARVGYDLPEDTVHDNDGFHRPWLDADRLFGLSVVG